MSSLLLALVVIAIGVLATIFAFASMHLIPFSFSSQQPTSHDARIIDTSATLDMINATATKDQQSLNSTTSRNEYNQTKIMISKHKLIADLAISTQQQSLGLSVKQNMTENQGMLFVFSSESQHPFWMKDMKFPIDIIWINSNQTVVHIEHSLQPCKSDEDCQVYSPDVNSLYVLETVAGYTIKYQVDVGTQIMIGGSCDSQLP